MKTLNDIKQDMSDLYDALKSERVELKAAGELANIAGKFLKAEQLDLAREIFMKNTRDTFGIQSPPPDQETKVITHDS